MLPELGYVCVKCSWFRNCAGRNDRLMDCAIWCETVDDTPRFILVRHRQISFQFHVTLPQRPVATIDVRPCVSRCCPLKRVFPANLRDISNNVYNDSVAQRSRHIPIHRQAFVPLRQPRTSQQWHIYNSDVVLVLEASFCLSWSHLCLSSPPPWCWLGLEISASILLEAHELVTFQRSVAHLLHLANKFSVSVVVSDRRSLYDLLV